MLFVFPSLVHLAYNMTYISFFPLCFLTALFGYPIILLIFFCPLFEILKIVGFLATKGELKINWMIEILYLSTSLFLIAITISYYIFHKLYEYDAKKHERVKQFFKEILIYSGPFLWIAVPVLYTYLTFDEMGDIPFTCPHDYDYSSTVVLSACDIRLANLICMWAFPTLCSLYLISISLLTLISKGYNKGDEVMIEDYYNEDIIVGGTTFSSEGEIKMI
ncbi:hypothetical protein Glove_216g155 [Diversispora epigaea]|uniref:Uncharacterized protein n=1 Tax=Diversispora epigaea TaxID=1348612 RepID=A0A397IH15_9GLOM|nr:hypothetical protein Glove_216g155 [Diversispora epigaea]